MAFFSVSFFFGSYNEAYAAKSGAAGTQEEMDQNAEARKELPIETNDIPGWPAGPEIGAEAAILMDVDTGTILYAKNIHEELYPASTTKLLTCLLADEKGNMADMVPFSYEAVHSVPLDGSSIGMDAGQSITLEECLYGIMVGSANEVANAVAEYTSGSIEEFTKLMNERAAELGCTNSHFTNTNGLHDEDHYTSAYDLALIAKEYFSNDMLARIANTPRYHFEPTDTQPDDFYLKNKHALINGEVAYEGIRGGKTGFTSDARQTLVTCCERAGMRLICVIMMEETPNQFYDTVTLFDYGYSNFSLVKVSDYETEFTTEEKSFFKTGSDIFGNSAPFLSMNPDSRIVLPNTVSFDDLDTEVSFETGDAVAQIGYTFHGRELGTALVEIVDNSQPGYEFEHVSEEEIEEGNSGIAIEREGQTVFLNVKLIILIVSGTAVLIGIIIVLIRLGKEYHFSGRREGKRRRKFHRHGGRNGDLYL
ncbi:MAG: D-alanyl-D-alanine carboxypeptidase [Lachnospiraceae bacterium]|nr:D-alanyl-D-alanine carboxypeptidase [Lachnospiraceae bacterium]